MDFQQYIKPEFLILIPVLYLIGIAIKKSEIKDKLIPFILGIVAIILCAIYLFATSELGDSRAIATLIFTAIVQGILVAGASVYANQLVKQITKEE